MDRVELFLSMLNDESVLFQTYAKRRSKWGGVSVFVFEGDDEKYYSSILTVLCSSRYECLISGGRENSINLYNAIAGNRQFSNDETFFFVDGDFSYDFRPKDKLYVTSVHSIENYYCDSRSVRSLLRSEIGLAKIGKSGFDDDDVLSDIQNIYDFFHERFLMSKEIRKVNNLLFLYCFIGSTEELNLNQNLVVKPVFLMEDKNIVMKVSVKVMGGIQQVLKGRLANGLMDLIPLRRGLDIHRKNRRCRGKEELGFLKGFLDSCNQGVIYDYVKTKYNRKLSISSNGSDLLSFGAQYAYKPTCLIEFVKSVH